MSLRRRMMFVAVVIAPLLLAVLAVFGVLLMRQGGVAPFRVPAGGAAPAPATAAVVARGEYFARLGNCVGCHTRPGGAPLAGGRAFRTEYGTVYSTNLTPDPRHGIGAWSANEFRHAMRHGISRNGVLSPVFPYASFRHLDDADLDALLGWLRTQPASSAPRIPNRFAFPANLPGAMAAWRLLYLRPSAPPATRGLPAARGAYLVSGIGHCATCHAARGAFASQGTGSELWGARNGGWFAPALHGTSLRRFAEGDVARYLQGAAPRAIGGHGLMADVIAGNLQHLTDEDAHAIEAWLRSLPAPPPRPAPPRTVRAGADTLELGRAVYRDHCADCHGERGDGEAGKYPPLRGSPAITQDDPINLVKLVLFGAIAPSTPSHPSPYSMPPFAHRLRAEDVAAVATALRTQENPDAAPVSADDVRALGGIQ